MEDTATAVEILQKLKTMGVGLSIDDFGTGYSSLSYLHRLPFDTLKIDRSFVDGMATGKEGWAIVKTIMNLADNLQMHVIAEGIETARQWSQLQGLSCTHGQGYYISRPLSSTAAGAFIEARRPALDPVPVYWSTLQAV
jgi:EAL domain-containing protein (putative c-di-GMP-specific phosphodiesterase class I)